METTHIHSFLVFLIIIIALLLFIESFTIYWLIRIIKKKNRLIKQKQQALNDCSPQKESDNTKTSDTKTKAECDNELFVELNRIIIDESLYLKPTLSRDELLKRMHINKNHFANLIQKNTGTNFNGYINNLRLEHAQCY